MSTFLSNVGTNGSPLSFLLSVTDDRIAPTYQWAKQPPRQAQSPWADGQLWPRSIGLGGQFSSYGMVSDDAGQVVTKWEIWGGMVPWAGWATDDTGGCTQNCLVGQTLDQYGNPLGSCIVQGFVTATDAFVGQVTSDVAGWYKLPTPYSTATQHYVVCYLAGSPDVAGTSVNTLLPTATG